MTFELVNITHLFI